MQPSSREVLLFMYKGVSKKKARCYKGTSGNFWISPEETRLEHPLFIQIGSNMFYKITKTFETAKNYFFGCTLRYCHLSPLPSAPTSIATVSALPEISLTHLQI